MPGETPARSEPRLTLQSRLEEVALLWPWAESIAQEHAASPATRYAIHLCLEEALSNVIVHGYAGQPGHPIVVEFSSAPGELVFTVEDQAPPFDPLAFPGSGPGPAPSSASSSSPAASLPTPSSHDPSSIDPIPLGGQGIRLMRKFAGSLSYTRLAHGNRLTLRFPVSRA